MTPINKVYLVGAGPGDPGLLTVKAKRILEKADVVLYDALVHPTLLSYCPNAKCISVGKRRGKHSVDQAKIHQLMRHYAKNNRVVVRLKGGDPMVFGRAGEEMSYLAKNHIPFEIIPGVSSVIAAPTYAGIPITHRDLSRSMAVISGTPKKGEGFSKQDVPKVDALIVVMAIMNLDKIVAQLQELPWYKTNTPVALIYSATTADQCVITGTLGTIVEQKNNNNRQSHGLLVVGNTVELADQLNWRQTLPLALRRVLVLRSLSQAGELVDRLAELGADVIQVPLLKIVPNKHIQAKIQADFLHPFTTVIFTSPNGVALFFNRLFDQKLDTRVLAGKTIVAVGPKTVDCLRQFGVVADMVPTRYIQEGILETLPPDLRNEHILIPTSAGARKDLKTLLRKRGATVVNLPIYRTTAPSIPNTVIQDGDDVVFTSSSTAKHFFTSKLYSGQAIRCFCLGPITAQTVQIYQKTNVWVAKDATLDGLIECLLG